jgi:hypothetical protein
MRIKLNHHERQQSKVCVYCGITSGKIEREHVFPRGLFEKPFPRGITVPACRECNSGFSKDEQYFIAFVAGISDSPVSNAKVDEGIDIDRAFVLNPAFEQRFIDRTDVSDGLPAITPELDRIERVILKMTRGLYWNQYGLTLNPERTLLTYLGLSVNVPTALLFSFHTSAFRLKKWQTVQVHSVSFTFVRTQSTPLRLLCGLSFYNNFIAIIECPSPSVGRISSSLELFK